MGKVTIYSDGGARGNPGPAGIGAIVLVGEKNNEISKFIGETTNNQAEYRAVIEALEWVKSNTADKSDLEIECFLDSQLVVEQLNQRYKLKNEGLKPLFWQIRDLIMALGGKVNFKYVPREQNAKADKLVNKAIDEGIK